MYFLLWGSIGVLISIFCYYVLAKNRKLTYQNCYLKQEYCYRLENNSRSISSIIDLQSIHSKTNSAFPSKDFIELKKRVSIVSIVNKAFLLKQTLTRYQFFNLCLDPILSSQNRLFEIATDFTSINLDLALPITLLINELSFLVNKGLKVEELNIKLEKKLIELNLSADNKFSDSLLSKNGNYKIVSELVGQIEFDLTINTLNEVN